ncbi:MAG: hypothetical protein HN793_13500 [Rhodospirillaceae bacterium]|jgi:hypothetical protein|nr:hypothetical protein [Rhodospirillaceae bacterium]MBT5241108.1 hypothetical protein [Rhodospirillaceae bacterium]MBT5566764.1 hypothetical protein [Rhodospirillaceae bacterium]MBT6090826.1 hypothetical protein [Rhodospirillaceae bacterium]MBT6961332.1 hypothetical protein [Rhodospirillaceae bacterium]
MTAVAFDLQILWPVILVMALTVVSGAWLLKLRVGALKTRQVRMAFYASYRDGEEPEQVAVATRHYANLYETPVLFYLGCLVAGILGPVGPVALSAAWGFAGLRIAQSLVHLTSNNVMWRANAFWASCVMLFTLWGINIDTLLSMSG